MKLSKYLFIIVTFCLSCMLVAISSEASEATYTPAVWNDLSKDVKSDIVTYNVPANDAIVIPITIKSKGALNVSAVVENATGTTDILYINIFEEEQCQQPVLYNYISVGSEWNDKFICLEKEGTYYLKVENTESKSALQLSMKAYFISGADRNLKSGKATLIWQNEYGKWIYSKFKATKTGYVKVSAKSGTGKMVYVKVLDNKKKDVSVQHYLNQDNQYAYVGVQKGKTYYIATKSSDDYYNLTYKLTGVKEKSGSQKEKAVTLKKGKTAYGVQIANRKKNGADWYKINIKKKQSIKIIVNGKLSADNDLRIQVIPANKEVKFNNDIIMVENNKKTVSTDVLYPGTYYIKVFKTNKKASGWYSIKWK